MILRNRFTKLCLVLFEGLLIYLCGVAATYLRFGIEAPFIFSVQRGWLKILLLTVIGQGAFYLFDLYDFRLIRQRATLYMRLCQALGLGALCLALIFYVLPSITIGRGVFVVSLLLMLSVMVGWRLLVMWLLGHPRLSERVLILGTGERAIRVAREMLDRRENGYLVLGFVGDDPAMVGRRILNPSVIGLTTDLEAVAASYQADRIVVAFDDPRSELPTSALLKLKFGSQLSIDDSSVFYEDLTKKVNIKMLQPSGLIFAFSTWWMPFYKRARGLVDAVLAVTGLILGSPLMLIAAIAIRLDSKGPVFYRQERIGLNDRKFKIIKFRSMYINAEEAGPVWAGRRDPRVTRIGKVLRKLRIDELPQFINILRGEMSFIGPRPEREVFVDQFREQIPYYSQRHLIKPGITGWAQVRYPYGASLEDAIEKLQYDLFYIKNQSPLLDMIILFETIRIVLFGRFAR